MDVDLHLLARRWGVWDTCIGLNCAMLMADVASPGDEDVAFLRFESSPAFDNVLVYHLRIIREASRFGTVFAATKDKCYAALGPTLARSNRLTAMFFAVGVQSFA